MAYRASHLQYFLDYVKCPCCIFATLSLLSLHFNNSNVDIRSIVECAMQTLRKTLDARGFRRVKIIAADLLPMDAWTIVDDILQDPELFHAVSVVGSVFAI